ncbi:MAG: SpoIIE family protein phosphatase [Clostridia bacterium]|nr:SpoIIE family protein phosphatase [Clostridia bacterium]
MEKLIREIFYAPADGRSEARARRAGLLLPGLALAAFSALLGSYAPFEGLAPFGAAAVMAAWYAGLDPSFAAAGAAAGCLLGGFPAYAIVCAGLGGVIYLINSQGSIQRLYRLLAAFAAECLLFLPVCAAFHIRAALAVGSAAVSVLAAVVLGCGMRSLGSLLGGRSATDTELLTVSAMAGLAVLAMRNFNIAGVSPAMVFAGVCALFASYRLGAPAVACAVTAAAGRVLACGGDMHFIAVLSAMTLVGASLRSLGKWACLAGFALTGVCFAVFIKGLYIFNYAELALSSLVFALVPQRLYMRGAFAGADAFSGRGYGRLQLKVAELADVLSELARVSGGREGRMLGCISDTLRRALQKPKPRRERLKPLCGRASVTREGSSACGDSALVRQKGGRLLLALSDGMGSGREAANESRSALALISDLLSVGFGVEEAAGLTNDLLTRRGGGDMYATLDVMLIDLEAGTAGISKHGAPPGFVLRGDELISLYAEGLPVGIIENARSASGEFELHAGDTVVLMTDGASDALGEEIETVLARCVLGEPDADLAANAIIAEAAKHGAADDMTVIVARIEAA